MLQLQVRDRGNYIFFILHPAHFYLHHTLTPTTDLRGHLISSTLLYPNFSFPFPLLRQQL